MSSRVGRAEGQRRRRFLVVVLIVALVGLPAAAHTTEARAAAAPLEACGIPAASAPDRSLAQRKGLARSSLTGTRSRAGSDSREPLVLFLIALVVTFGLTRLYTRRARVAGTGGFRVGGVHVHHLVFGIVIALASGLVAIATSPGSTGRDVLAIAFGAGAALTLDEFALVCLLKGKFGLGIVAVFVPFVGLAPAVRLAKPRSLWSEWFYASTPQKLARARSRYSDVSRFERLRRVVADVIGGAPSFPALDAA
jgi:hypothetical protein